MPAPPDTEAPPPTAAAALSSTKSFVRVNNKEGLDINALYQAEGKAGKALLDKIREADVNQDGHLSAAELLAAFKSAVDDAKAAKLWRRIAAAALLALLILAATVVGLTAVVIVKTKDTNVSGGMLVSKDSGEVLRVASSDFKLADGKLVSHDGDKASIIGVSTSQRSVLDVNMSMEQLAATTHLSMVLSGGIEMTAQVQAAFRVPTILSTTGAELQPMTIIFLTSLGKLSVTNTTMTMGDDFTASLAKSGVQQLSSNPGRRLTGFLSMSLYYSYTSTTNVNQAPTSTVTQAPTSTANSSPAPTSAPCKSWPQIGEIVECGDNLG